MKKILQIIFAFTVFVSFSAAEGPLMMKGFHHDIPFEEACKIMSTFKSERGDFMFDEKQKKCGFGRNGFISYPHILGNADSDKVDMIILSPDVVDDLFESKTLTSRKFSEMFLSQYDWINHYQPTGKYHQISQKYGWKISISRQKWIKIMFFDKKDNSLITLKKEKK